MAIYPSGRYINSKFNLCHNPSFATIVLCNSGLSAIMNSTKNNIANIKDIADIIPVNLSPDLNEIIDNNNETNKSNMKPIADPAPCIFDAVVTTSFVSFTLKKQVNIHAPTAKIAINITDTTLKDFDV